MSTLKKKMCQSSLELTESELFVESYKNIEQPKEITISHQILGVLFILMAVFALSMSGVIFFVFGCIFGCIGKGIKKLNELPH